MSGLKGQPFTVRFFAKRNDWPYRPQNGLSLWLQGLRPWLLEWLTLWAEMRERPCEKSFTALPERFVHYMVLMFMSNKTLLLLRHAKSSWKTPELDDHERPLNGRGRKAAVRVGQLLKDDSLIPDLVLCSTSKRTRETAELVFAEFHPVPSIVYLDELYHAEPDRIADTLAQIVEPTRCVMLIGHNPGLEEFLSMQTGEIHSMPTAALAQIDYKLDTWSQFKSATCGALIRLWRPRELDEE